MAWVQVGCQHTRERESCGAGIVCVDLQVQIWEPGGLRKASGPHAGCRGLTRAGPGPFLTLYAKTQLHRASGSSVSEPAGLGAAAICSPHGSPLDIWLGPGRSPGSGHDRPLGCRKGASGLSPRVTLCHSLSAPRGTCRIAA